MFKASKGLKMKVLKNKGLITVISIVLFLLIPSFFTPSYTAAVKKNSVLGVAVKSRPQIPTPEITITPTPTISVPTSTLAPTPTPASNAAEATPTPTPVSVQSPTDTPTPTPASNAADPTPTPASNAAEATPTETPTPAGLKIQIGIDYVGQRPADSYTAAINQGQSAWDALVAAIGLSNLQYTDYGGDMGIFITGLNGVNAASNQYFEFRVNGVSSMVGVSSYKCNDGDKLDFVLTSF